MESRTALCIKTYTNIYFTRYFFYPQVIIPVWSYYHSQFFISMTVYFPSLTFISRISLQVKTTSGVIMDVSGHGGCVQLKVDTDNNTTGKG